MTSLGYKPSAFGNIRICLWAIFFLVLAGLYLPEKESSLPFSENVRGLPVAPRVTLPSDPAFVTEQGALTTDGLHIAWISDSSSVIYKPGAKFLDFSKMGENGLLPLQTLDELKRQGVTDPHMDLYIRLSLRSLEAYTLTRLALEADADIIVLTLNPFFVFNDHAVFKGQSHFARASQVWISDAPAWPWLALFPSPSDHLWALIGRHFKVLSDAPAFAGDVQILKSSIWMTIFAPLNGRDDQTRSGDSGEGLKENSMIFWVTQKYLNGDLSKLVNEKNEAVNSKWYRQLIRLNNLDENSFNHIILLRTLEAIKASGKRALIYLAPVSENLRDDPEAWEQYRAIKDKLDGLSQAYGGKNISIVTEIPEEALAGSVFVKDDDVHLNAAGKFPQFLAASIKKIVDAAENPAEDAPHD